MNSRRVDQLGMALSQARRTTTLLDIDLRAIGSMQEAEAIQEAALEAYGGRLRGYTLAATSSATARLLGCSDPVSSRLIDDHVIDSGTTLRLPHGTLGVGAQFIFVIGAPLKDALGLKAVLDAIVSCHLGLQVLGRRVPPRVPLNAWSATADFALDVACVRGPRVDDWERVALGDTAAALRLNGHRVAGGSGGDVLGSPVAAVVWLSRILMSHGTMLQAGDLVATGSCTGLAQVAPGQRVQASFAGLGDVDLALA